MTVEGCNEVMKRQFPCLWTASAQGEDGKRYRHASFYTTWSLSLAPRKWVVRMTSTAMAVNIVIFLKLFQEWHTVGAQFEVKKKKKKEEER